MKEQNRRYIIDGHCILHKVGYAQASQLVLNKDFNGVIMGLIRTIADFVLNSSQVILVFDGQCLPNKMETINKRRADRESAFQRLQTENNPEERRRLLSQCVSFSLQDVYFIANMITWLLNNILNTKVRIDMSEQYKSSIDRSLGNISSEKSSKVDIQYFNETLVHQLTYEQQVVYQNVSYNMTNLLMKVQKYIPNSPKCNFYTCIAPYEADAQIVYLCKAGYGDTIVTIDSDLTIYGAADVYLKYDVTKSSGDLVTLNDVFEGTFSDLKSSKNRFYALRKVAILSGCDYVKSLVGVGLKKAYAALQEESNIISATDYLISKYNVKNPYDSMQEYQFNILQALFTFQYQVVFNPKARSCYHLHEIISEDVQLYEIFEEKATGRTLNKKDAILHCQPGILKYQRAEQLKTIDDANHQKVVIAVEEMMDQRQLKSGKITINCQDIGQARASSPERPKSINNINPQVFKSYQNAKYRE